MHQYEHNRINFNDQLRIKYNSYQNDGKLVLTVTLSTYVTDDRFAASAGMATFWNNVFIPKFVRRLPYKFKTKFDHDYVVERAPHGNWHFHGLMAFHPDAKPYIWRDGQLNRHLVVSLHNLRTTTAMHSLGFGSYDIQSIKSQAGGVDAWVNYMTKTTDFKSSDEYPCHNPKIVQGTSVSTQFWMPSSRNSARQQCRALPR